MMTQLVHTLFAIFFAPPVVAADLAVRPAYDVLQGSTYQGSVGGFAVDVPVRDDVTLSPAVRFLDRKFDGGAELRETSYDFGATFKFTQVVYLDAQINVAPDADILPVTAGTLTPHFVTGREDFSLAFNESRFRTILSGYVAPGWLHEFSELFSAGAGVFFARSDRSLTAGHLYAVTHPTEPHSFRVDLAAGQTLEDAGLSADFNSVAGEYGYRFGRVGIWFSVTRYWSTLRTEDGYGLRLEFR